MSFSSKMPIEQDLQDNFSKFQSLSYIFLSVQYEIPKRFSGFISGGINTS